MVMGVGLTQLPILTRKAKGMIVRFYCGDFKNSPSKSKHCALKFAALQSKHNQ
jgi:hypothetical protein